MSVVRVLMGFGALFVVAACTPSVPDSGRGVSDASLADARAVREAELSGLAAAANQTGPVKLPIAVGETVQLNAATNVAPYAGAEGVPAVNPALTAATTPVQPSVDQASPVRAATGISDEQSFEAVTARETIESDANRLAQNAAQYQVVQPTALPTRPTATGPNIVEYAMSTNNPVGNKIYRRFGINAQAKYDRNCRTFANPSLAQIDFLANGGPKRDRKGLDPDGDGYACSWDPAAFRIPAPASQ